MIHHREIGLIPGDWFKRSDMFFVQIEGVSFSSTFSFVMQNLILWSAFFFFFWQTTWRPEAGNTRPKAPVTMVMAETLCFGRLRDYFRCRSWNLLWWLECNSLSTAIFYYYPLVNYYWRCFYVSHIYIVAFKIFLYRPSTTHAWDKCKRVCWVGGGGV